MMSTSLLYSLVGLLLFVMGLAALIGCAHPLRKILGVNVMASGVFLVLIAAAYRPIAVGEIDPALHAMVLTGIVVSVSTTALALILACRVQETSRGTGRGPTRKDERQGAGE